MSVVRIVCSADCVYLRTTVVFVAGDPSTSEERFEAQGKRMLLRGFTEIQPYAAFDDEVLPPFVVGEKVRATCDFGAVRRMMMMMMMMMMILLPLVLSVAHSAGGPETGSDAAARTSHRV
jgi:hypothetical protein